MLAFSAFLASNLERKVSNMHVDSAFPAASFTTNVSFRHLNQAPLGGPPVFVRTAAEILRAAGQALGFVAQGLMFALAMWLLLAAPGFMSGRDGPIRVEAARQASR